MHYTLYCKRLYCKHVYFNGIDAQVWFDPIKFYRNEYVNNGPDDVTITKWPKWCWFFWLCSIFHLAYTNSLQSFSDMYKKNAIFLIFCSSIFFLMNEWMKKEKCKITIWMRCRFRRTLFKQTNVQLTEYWPTKMFWLSYSSWCVYVCVFF